MASSANNNTSNKLSIRQVNLTEPDREEIAFVLDSELKLSYMEASVEWVTSHPDLSEPPFKLAAPGIYGNTALLEFGDMSYFNLPFASRKMYNFRQILKRIDRHDKNSFIFGHGIHRPAHVRTYRELVLNTLFLPVTNEEIQSRNKSLIFIGTKYKRCDTLMFTYSSCIEGTVQGTYFLCDGLRTDVSVLKVYAKGPYLDKKPFCGSERFINSMRYALENRYGSEHFVALGGVYTVNGVVWTHGAIRNDWEPRSTTPDTEIDICHVNVPETMITIFNSSTKPQISSGFPIKLNSCRSIHSLSHHSSSEKQTIINVDNMEEEYLGYFCPATTLYCIDAPLQ